MTLLSEVWDYLQKNFNPSHYFHLTIIFQISYMVLSLLSSPFFSFSLKFFGRLTSKSYPNHYSSIFLHVVVHVLLIINKLFM